MIAEHWKNEAHRTRVEGMSVLNRTAEPHEIASGDRVPRVATSHQHHRQHAGRRQRPGDVLIDDHFDIEQHRRRRHHDPRTPTLRPRPRRRRRRSPPPAAPAVRAERRRSRSSGPTTSRSRTRARCAFAKRPKRSRRRATASVDIQVFPNNQLGGDTDMLSQVRSGAIDIFPLSGLILQTLVPVAGINGLAFAFKDYQTVWAAMDGDLGALCARRSPRPTCMCSTSCWTTAIATSPAARGRSTRRTT